MKINQFLDKDLFLNKPVMSVKEASKHYCYSERWISRLCKTRQLRAFKDKGRWWIIRDD